MKIIWVNPEFLDYRVPVYEELQALCKGEFYIIFSKVHTPDRVIQKTTNALGKHAIGLSDREIVLKKRKNNFANTGLTIRYPEGLMKIIEKIKPDAIICEGFFKWSPYALLKAYRMHIPAFVVYERTKHTERNCPWWREKARKLLSPFIEGFIINGILTHEYLQDIGYDKKNHIKGCMAADSHNLAEKAAKIKKELTTTEAKEGIEYLYVGQIVKRKGVEYLLKYWKKHIESYPDDKLKIIGNGPLLNNFKRQYIDLQSIHFIGSVDYDLIYQYYAKADVFIIPTLEDNWSLVVPEAMACGLPIATSIYNGCHPELVHEGENGYTFDPLSETSFLLCLSKFHQRDLPKMGEKSIEIEKEYTPDKVANRIFHFIDSTTCR